MQPFQRSGAPGDGVPADDPLLRLHSLNISDKHRMPVGVNLVPTEMSFAASAKFETAEGAAANVPPNTTIMMPLRPGIAFFRWTTTHPLEVAEGSFAIQGKLCLLSDEGILELEPTLMQLLRHVTLVRDYFAPDFG